MTKPFVYDEKSSSLYSPSGEFIKKIYCPKAVNWNQLLADDPLDRSRGCNNCRERIINLDALPVDEACSILMNEPKTCVYATQNSENVIFIQDSNNPGAPQPAPDTWYGLNETPPNLPIISTVRTLKDIQRGIQIGFWPDIRKVEYNTSEIRSKLCVYQNKTTGEIKVFGDYRISSSDVGESWEEVVPWSHFYSHYQEIPVAAYLIPKNLPNNTQVLIPDPIEDLVGASWNQGDAYRADNVTAAVINKKVVLDPLSIKRSDFMG